MRLLFAAVSTIALAAPALAASTMTAPLIERTKLFGNPVKSAARLSPDGKWLSWTAPRDGVLNLWVAPAVDLAKARPLTGGGERPIRQYYWAPDSKSLLFVNDKGGDENFKIYGVDVVTARQTTLTPFDKARAEFVMVGHTVKDRILVSVNNRNPEWNDVYSLELATGKLTLVKQNDGYDSFIADEQLNLRIAIKPTKDGGREFYRVNGTTIEAKPFATIGLEDSQTTQPFGFTTDGKTLYWQDSRGRDTAALIAQDFATGATKVIGEDRRADIGEALTDPISGRVQAFNVEYLRDDWVTVDPAIKGDLDFLEGQLKGSVSVTSRTDADDRWTVTVDPVTVPVATYLYDRKAKKLTQLFVGRPELIGAPLVAMHPLEIKARDGLTLVSYLSLPPGSDTNGDGIPDKPVPMVLFVHGGPWGRDSYGYNGVHQWLANRGYAVLSVNFRASTGFGKKFIAAGDLQWGLKMHDDLLDAVDWAVKTGVTPRDKVAIMGGSYGGYATLAGMTVTPTTFACGVDIVGPSNLQTLLKTIPPYWAGIRTQFVKRMGDPDTEAGRATLKAASPLFAADKIQRPLLIGQGANDPRVNVAESNQIVDAMKAKNIPVTYVLFPDEGHGFAKPANSIAFYAVAENFLGACLGGRAEPIGNAVTASSATVPYGAQFAPGLAAAIGGR